MCFFLFRFVLINQLIRFFPYLKLKNKQREQETLNSVCIQNVCHGYCQRAMDRSEEYTLGFNYVKCEKLHIQENVISLIICINKSINLRIIFNFNKYIYFK